MDTISLATIIFALVNSGIFVGYILFAIFIVPSTELELQRTKTGGALFFVTCGLTHAEMAIHSFTPEGITAADFTSWHMMVIHIIQFLAVLAFFNGVYHEFVLKGNSPALQAKAKQS